MELNQFSTVDIVLDKANDNIIQKQFVSAGDKDGRSLTVQLADNGVIGEIIGAALNLYWHNQASGLTDLSAFYVVDRATSVFKIDYPQYMLTPGKVIAYIQILHGGKVTHTKPFEITVQKLAGTTRGVLATAEYGALVTTLAKANEFETEIAFLDNGKVDKGGNEQVTIGMLSQQVKEIMAGANALPVVTENSVNTSNVVDEAITPQKVSFLERYSKNLLSPDFKYKYNCSYQGGVLTTIMLNAYQPFYLNIANVGSAIGGSDLSLAAGTYYLSCRVKTVKGTGEISPSFYDGSGIRSKFEFYSGNRGPIPTSFVSVKFKVVLDSPKTNLGLIITALSSDQFLLEDLMISDKDIDYEPYHQFKLTDNIVQTTSNENILKESIFDNRYFDFTYLRTYAHRGLVHPINQLEGYPENTVEAFEYASGMGVGLIEFDIKRTLDNKFVVCHDETINRTSNGSGAVSAKTLAELKSFDFSYVGGQKLTKFLDKIVEIPTLEEAIISCKKLGLNIVLDIGILNWDIMLVHYVVMKHNYQKHVMYNIQSIYYIQRLLSYDPHATVFYTQSTIPSEQTILDLISLKNNKNIIGFGTQYSLFTDDNPSSANNLATVKRLTDNDIVVSAATINEEELIRYPNLIDKLVAHGVTCICTDDLRIEQKQKIVMNINDYIQLNQTER